MTVLCVLDTLSDIQSELYISFNHSVILCQPWFANEISLLRSDLEFFGFERFQNRWTELKWIDYIIKQASWEKNLQKNIL